MNIRVKLSALRETRWHEYLVRFVLGGLATVGTGAIASLFGPETGGLFLAFPAIFCASATLVEKHERERKEKAGLLGTRRGKCGSCIRSRPQGYAFGHPPPDRLFRLLHSARLRATREAPMAAFAKAGGGRG
jgi:hypothetical protein